jgi:hypothetical protein
MLSQSAPKVAAGQTSMPATLLASLPGLPTALDMASMSSLLRTTVTDARLIRNKGDRRALIRYTTTSGPMIGKLRANHRATTPFLLLQSLRAVGFDDNSMDCIRVPEPVAAFSDLGLWVQRLVPGTPMVDLLEEPLTPLPQGAAWLSTLGRRAAEAAHKIHTSGIPTRRTHYIENELQILAQRFTNLSQQRPLLASRLDHLLTKLRQIAATLASRPACPIHRDYYPDQLLVNGRDLTIVDFDLFCHGDPALDIGNFIGHNIELALRVHHDPTALNHVSNACKSTYIELAGESHRAAIDVYTRLTVARHISLSTEIEGRSQTTDALLHLSEISR